MFVGKVVLAALLLAGAGIDAAKRKIPNALICAGLASFALMAVQLFREGNTALLAGCLWAGTLSFFIHFIPWLTRSMGAGDVKLALVTGLLSGWEDWLGFMGAYSLVLLIASAALFALGRRKPETIPLGPLMAAAWFLYHIVALNYNL